MSNHQNKPKYPYGYGLSKISLLKLYMNKANVMRWSFILGLAGLFIPYFWSLLREHVLIGEVYKFLDGYILAIGFFIWGFLGMFWVYRRQVPQAVMVKGKSAFIIGLFMMIGCWLLALYSMVMGTRALIEYWMK